MHGELETDSSPDFGWKEGGMVLQDEERRGEEGGIRSSGRLITKTEILLRETRPPHSTHASIKPLSHPSGFVLELVYTASLKACSGLR